MQAGEQRSTSAHPARPSGLLAEKFIASLRADDTLAKCIAHVHEEAARSAEMAPLPSSLPEALRQALERLDRSSLYRHQREAIEHATAGRNVVIATETSSGKTLCFQAPVLASTATDPAARALLIFPTNPLANDQDVALRRFVDELPAHARPRGIVRLQGGMGADKHRLAGDDPQIVLTNPEMVHLHLLPQHARWERLWRGLRYIVVDEIHLYRGVFGGHLANLLRRIRRCAWRYGARPVVIAASATVGNPKALAEELCAAPFELVGQSTAARGPRTTVLWQPPQDENGRPGSYIDEAVMLFDRALASGLQSILFARSRSTVELIVSQLEQQTRRSRVQLGVRAYRGGYLREEREVIERDLRSGAVRGVVTTNALEVGIDIGSLDVCISAGYPGSIMALRQQAGRVGRRDRASATFLIASANPLDTYVMQHPRWLLGAEPEHAVVGRLNPHILKSHLACAAAEFPLWEAELDRLGGDVARKAAAELVEKGEARWAAQDGRNVLAVAGRPHNAVSLRTASQERYSLVGPEGDVIGDMDGSSVAREAFPGAIYIHQGRTFRVIERQEDNILLGPARRGLSTRVQGERNVAIGEISRERWLLNDIARVSLAKVDVTDSYSSFLELGDSRKGKIRVIDPPEETSLRTEALVLTLAPRALASIHADPVVGVQEALHGAEHVLGAMCSTLVLCDRDEVDGDVFVEPDLAGLVLFDRFPGGLGIAAAAFDAIDAIVERAGATIDGCTCSLGCPACVHTARCLHGNEGVEKAAAQFLLRLLRGIHSPVQPVVRRSSARVPAPAPAVRPQAREGQSRRKKNARTAATARELQPGDRVEHGAYGIGRVIEVRPSGRVVVDFGDGRARRITRTWLQLIRDETVSPQVPGAGRRPPRARGITE
jgi:DEAD/DEAH box helicase domain-containing protein